MISVDEAREKCLALAGLLPPEWVALSEAATRALAEPVMSRRAHPPFDASAMDGYAVRAADVASVPVTLSVIGSAPAGSAFDGQVGAGQAVRIFTGAPVPPGADTIILQEDTDTRDGMVIVREGAKPGRHIRRRGYDLMEGATLVASGTRLTGAHVALAAAGNVPWLSVTRRPRVALLATGDELVRPGEPLGPNQILSSNTLGIAALARAAGAEVSDLGIAPDRRDALAAHVEAARGADVLVTLGGASVGEHDLVHGVLTGAGFTLAFWKVAMRPGKPILLGQRGPQIVFGLPGNPVSAFVGALLFLRPTLLKMQGLDPALPTATARLGTPLAANDRRADFIRARLTVDRDVAVVTPLPSQDSAMLSAFARSGALILRPPHAPAAGAGTDVPILPLQGLL